MRKQKVPFLCTQNSARSRLAEGLLRHHAGDRLEVMSAGLEATDGVHPCAVAAMEEVGIDISDQRPKTLPPRGPAPLSPSCAPSSASVRVVRFPLGPCPSQSPNPAALVVGARPVRARAAEGL
jgi:hypothetical protein